MHSGLPLVVVAAIAPIMVSAQTCRKAPPPPFPTLFPESVQSLNRELSGTPTGGCMSRYRPAWFEPGSTSLWALVSIEHNREAWGESAVDLEVRYTTEGRTVIKIHGWPVGFTATEMGDEFATVRGSVAVTVLVKNGDRGPRNQQLAETFLAGILSGIPCG